MIPRNPLRNDIRHRNGLPVLPGDFPMVGHIPSFFHHMPEVLREGRRTLGPLFWVNSITFVGTWTLLWTERESFDLVKNKATANLGAADTKDPINFIGESMTALDGAAHQHIRGAVRGPFTPRGFEVNQVGKTMAEMIEARVRDWIQKRELTALPETQELTLNIIFRVLGIAAQDLPEWRHNYREMLLGAIPLRVDLPGFPLYRSRKAYAWVNQRLLALIDETRRAPSDTLLSSMVHGKDEEGKGLSDKELIENIRLMILAGHETTASIMAWVLITLAQRPDLWDALTEEAQKATAVPTSPADLRSYSVAEGLFREATRLYPPVSIISRKTTEPLTLHDHRIPPGTILGSCVPLLSRDPELYADPERFDPGRWKGRTPTPLETCQFGGGPHFCLGYHLAWMEVAQFSIVLARELARAGLRLQLGQGPSPRPHYYPVTQPPSKVRIELR